MADPAVYFLDPTGAVVALPPEQAFSAQRLGYQPATPDQIAAFQAEEARRARFDTPGQALVSGLEGAASGLTFGLSTGLEQALGVPAEDIAARKEFNPVAHGVGVLTGVAAPLVLSGGAAAPAVAGAEAAEAAGLGARALTAARGAAEWTAPALIQKAGQAAAGAIPEMAGVLGRVAPIAAQGAVEGALYAGADVTEQMLLKDPNLTAESAIAQVGLGALFGGTLMGGGKAAGEGLGAMFGKVSKGLESISSKLAKGDEQTVRFMFEHRGEIVALDKAVPGAADVVAAASPAQAKFIVDNAARIAPLEKNFPGLTKILARADPGTGEKIIAGWDKVLRDPQARIDVGRALTQSVSEAYRTIEDALRITNRSLRPAEVETLVTAATPDALGEAARLEKLIRGAVFEMKARPALYPGLYPAKLEQIADDLARLNPAQQGLGAELGEKAAPARAAWDFLRKGEAGGNGALEELAQATKRDAVAAGKGEVSPEVSQRLAALNEEIAKVEGSANLADPLERPSQTQPFKVALVPEEEGGIAFHPADEAAAAGLSGTERTVALPSWLSPQEFLENRAAWEWTWAATGGPSAPEQAQKLVHGYMARALEEFPSSEFGLKQGYTVARLIDGKGGQKFEALRRKLQDWALMPEGARPADPIDPHVWGGLIDTTRKDTKWVGSGRYINAKKYDTLDKWLAKTRAELDPTRETYGQIPPSFYTAEGPKAAAEAVKNAGSWAEFTKARMSEYMKKYGGHGPAMKQLGEEWAAIKAGAVPAAEAAEEGGAANLTLDALRAEKRRLEAVASGEAFQSASGAPRLDYEETARIVGGLVDSDFKGVVAPGGVSPEELAKRLGFRDGTDLLTSMLKAREAAGAVAPSMPATSADVYRAINDMKQALDPLARFGKLTGPEHWDAARKIKALRGALKDSLEDGAVWGAAAERQAAFNAAQNAYFTARKAISEGPAYQKLMQKRVLANGAVEFEANPRSVNSWVNLMADDRGQAKTETWTEYLRSARRLADEMERSGLTEAPAVRKAIDSATAVAGDIQERATLTQLVKMMQGHEILSSGPAIPSPQDLAVGAAASLAPSGIVKGVTEGVARLRSPAMMVGVIDALEKLAAKTQRAVSGGVSRIFEAGAAKGVAEAAGAAAPSPRVTRENFPHVAASLNHLSSDLDRLAETTAAETAPLADHAPATTDALHQLAARGVGLLGEKVPKGPERRPLDREFIPSDSELASLNRTLDIAHRPTRALELIARGSYTPEHHAALVTLYPKLAESMKLEVLDRLSAEMAKGTRLPYRTRLTLSLFLGTDLDSSTSAEAIAAAQAAHAMAPAIEAAQSRGGEMKIGGDQLQTGRQAALSRLG